MVAGQNSGLKKLNPTFFLIRFGYNLCLFSYKPLVDEQTHITALHL